MTNPVNRPTQVALSAWRIDEHTITNPESPAEEIERSLQHHADPIVRALAARLDQAEHDLQGFLAISENDGPDDLQKRLDDTDAQLDKAWQENDRLEAELDDLRAHGKDIERELADAKEHIRTLNQLIIARDAGDDLV